MVHPAPLLGVSCVQQYFELLFYTSVVSSHQGQAKADTNQEPVVLGVFIISMTLSIIFYLSVTLSILRLCSEFGAFNSLLHCFFALQWYPATKDRPRRTQTKDQRSLVPWLVVRGASVALAQAFGSSHVCSSTVVLG